MVEQGDDFEPDSDSHNRQYAKLKPGIYGDISFADYCDLPATNQSALQWAGCSMEHLKACLDGLIDDDTQPKKFGRAVHCRLLEPERYTADYLIATPCCQPLKSGNRKGLPCGNESSWCVQQGFEGEPMTTKWYCGIHKPDDAEQPADYVSQSDAAGIEAIAVKVKDHAVVKLFRQSGGFEATVIWEPRAGTLGKARCDKLIVGKERCPDTIVDIKKVQRGYGSWSRFSKDISNYSYDIQAAWYADAVQQVTGADKPPNFIWVCVEDAYPHSIGVYQCCKRLMDAGRSQYQEYLEKYLEAVASGEWPGYSKDIQVIDAPEWHYSSKGMA